MLESQLLGFSIYEMKGVYFQMSAQMKHPVTLATITHGYQQEKQPVEWCIQWTISMK